MALEEDIANLAMIVQRMVDESGQPIAFDARVWLNQWLAEPIPALGDRRPLDVLKQPGGLEIVQRVLTRMQSGSYS